MSTDTEPTIAEPARSFDPDALRTKYRAGARQAPPRRTATSSTSRWRASSPTTSRIPYVAPIEREPLTDEVDVVVIGGGFGGLLAGARLREAGVDDIRIIEKGGDFGGTWYWNRYPGAMCDVESYIYLPLLEEIGYVPKEKYAHAPGDPRAQPRDRRALRPLPQRVLPDRGHRAALGRRDAARWIVSTNRGDAMRARFVCMANGPLHRPKLPGIPGIETFKGHTFHTSRWDYDYTGGDSRREPHRPRRQARRHHRHRRHGGAVRPAPRRGGRAPVRLPAHAVVDRRARQPAHRSGVGSQRSSRAGSRQRMDNFNTLVSGGFAGRGPRQRRLDRHHRQAAAHGRSRRGRRRSRRGRSPRTMELADFEKMEQIRARVDEHRRRPGHRRGAQAVLPPVLQAAVLPRRVPRHLQPPERHAGRHRRPGRRAHHRARRRGERRRVRARLPRSSPPASRSAPTYTRRAGLRARTAATASR